MLKRRMRQKVLTITLLPPSVILTILCFLLNSGIYLLISGVLAVSWVVGTLINWRCPSCRALLPVAGDVITCEKCSSPLN